MSLILDALRKSEAERRRGQAPDLFASIATPPPSRAVEALRFWPVLVFVALAIVAGWIVWRDEEAASTTTTGSAPVDAPDARAEATVVPNTQPMRPVARPPTSGPAIVAGPVSAPPSATAPAPVTAPDPVSAPDARATAAGSASAPSTELRSLPARPVQMEVPTPPASTPLTEATAPSRADEVEPEPLPPIAVLGASERASLPPLKLSMHVFGSEPGNRFAIIDGQRVTEGSVLGGSIVEAIRRDGVVLNINGRRILLPRP